jgi:ABC-type antimicrobial peptide transport system permease subunit
MLRRVVLWIILLGILGLVVGYLIFARTAHGYLSLQSLLSPSKNVIDSLVKSVRGIPQVRQNILISAGVGAGIGLIAGAASGSARRRRRKGG